VSSTSRLYSSLASVSVLAVLNIAISCYVRRNGGHTRGSDLQVLPNHLPPASLPRLRRVGSGGSPTSSTRLSTTCVYGSGSVDAGASSGSGETKSSSAEDRNSGVRETTMPLGVSRLVSDRRPVLRSAVCVGEFDRGRPRSVTYGCPARVGCAGSCPAYETGRFFRRQVSMGQKSQRSWCSTSNSLHSSSSSRWLGERPCRKFLIADFDNDGVLP
jgi:hypothetical protein